MKNLFKTTIAICLLVLLSSCSEKLAPKRSSSEQQQVKEEVMKLLQEEYHQPFKLENFNYEYKTQYPNASGNKPYVIFGEFDFKVKSVDNPIIKFDILIRDMEKESINNLIDSFKKNQLNELYCYGLQNYYDRIKTTEKLKQPYVNQAESFCNSLNQKRYMFYKNYYLKHHTN